MDAADRLLAELLTAEEIEETYRHFGADVAFLMDKIQDFYVEAQRKVPVPLHVRQRLFVALRQSISDEELFDPIVGIFFWAHLRRFYRWAYGE